MEKTYKIVRFYADPRLEKEVIKNWSNTGRSSRSL